LGTKEKAAAWLHRSNRALGHVVPLDLVDTEIGARRVEQVLGRIEYGVYS
jgi:putative toxin-antitoxin system antitoxin component (TIGR02293 family)